MIPNGARSCDPNLELAAGSNDITYVVIKSPLEWRRSAIPTLVGLAQSTRLLGSSFFPLWYV